MNPLQNSLAQYYQDMNDPKTGVYFHEKCLEISRLTTDRGGEMSANHRLGVAYEKMVRACRCRAQCLGYGAIFYLDRNLDENKKSGFGVTFTSGFELN